MPASLAFSWAGFMTYPAIKGGVCGVLAVYRVLGFLEFLGVLGLGVLNFGMLGFGV